MENNSSKPNKSGNTAKTISLAKGTAIVSVLTLLSRLLGFVRDLLIARGFGSSVYSDCFFVAFRIPNLLRSFVAEGALSSAFVPVFADSLHRDQNSARDTIRRISCFILIITSILSLLGMIFADQIVAAFAPGFKEDQELLKLCIELTRYMLPIVVCVSFVAMINGALNTLGNFGASAWSQVWMNIILIAGAFWALGKDPIWGVRLLAISALIGAIVQVAIQLPALRKANLSILPKFNIFHSEIISLIKLMLPAIIGATVYQLGIFLNTMLASLLSQGSVSWLYYADRLVQFPLGTFSIALSSVLLPALSLSHAAGDSKSFDLKTFSALRYTSFFIMPVAALIFILAEPFTKLLFERGSFSEFDTEMTANAVRMYAIGIWAVSSHSLFARTFIARKDTLTNTLIGIAALLVNFLASLLLIGPLESQNYLSNIIANIQALLTSALPSLSLGHSGLSLASSCGAIFSLLAIGLLASKHLNSGWKVYLISSLKSLIASLAMVLILANLPALQLDFYLNLIIKILIALSVWCTAIVILRPQELTEIYELIKKRRKSKAN